MYVAYFFIFGWRLIFHDLAAYFLTSIVGYSDLYHLTVGIVLLKIDKNQTLKVENELFQ
jgi:hypothetical protein